MRLSFETRFCTLPVARWTFPLTYLPLSASCTLSEICSAWLPPNPSDVRIFLLSCCTLLLINNLASFVFLLTRNAVQAKHPAESLTKERYLHYLLIVWQTNSLLVQGYIWYQISHYLHVEEVVHLLPLCLSLLCLDTCYAIALNGSIRVMLNIFYRAVIVAFHATAWLLLLISLMCAVHREYVGCSFIT
ncbi:uncharacterized protein LOC128709337 [Anopheles marshallii]|uniref:uncharacterized protein LOC128709337 n=1 Tax=Anopheles marshallii TaxID=1521116 RepID=UPI00237B4257|nr:uncharacterized protein LOC128709337 [Anopheles marshallii]